VKNSDRCQRMAGAPGGASAGAPSRALGRATPAVSSGSLAPFAVFAKKPTQVAASELAIEIHRIRIWREPERLKEVAASTPARASITCVQPSLRAKGGQQCQQALRLLRDAPSNLED